MKKLISFLFIFYLLFAGISKAQWFQTGFTSGNGAVVCFAVSGTNLFAGCQNGVFVTNNYGTNWIPIGLQGNGINSLAISGSAIFAGTYGHGVYLTTNSGASWSPVNNGLTNLFVNALVFSGTNLFAGTLNGVFRTTNNGTTWTPAGLTGTHVNSFAVSGINLFAGTSNGVFYSTNNGANWAAVNTGLTNLMVNTLAFSGTNLFAGTQNGVFRTTNNGISWTPAGLTGSTFSALLDISGTYLLAGNNLGNVFLTTNSGTTWTNVSTGLPTMGILCLAFIPGADPLVFAGNDASAIYRRLLTQMLSVKVISSVIPTQFSLKQNYPNPFNPTTKIEFSLPKNVFANLIIYDILGREVERLVNEQLNAATYEVIWDASNYPGGVYYYKLQADNYVETKKMILLK
ncbi:MAG: T9SS type A sorting domain-containing protein [Ignavibacteria bacterium]